GDLHVHTDASADAQSSLDEMAEEAARLGRRYLAITDHSRSRPLGITGDQLHEHCDAIWRTHLAHRGELHLLTGLEVDILPDGSLDLPPRDLAGLDCVVASVHSHFAMSRDEMTARIVRALRSGVVHILGHPTGRQIGARPPYDFDLELVLAVARQMGVALEVNAMPDRLDLTDSACRLAKEAGVKLVINSDAHNTSHLGNLRYGVWVARRGWLEKEDVLNTLPLDALRRFWRARREQAEGPAAPGP
ncbi:MAG TPA: PHP domain-containing protein, partial [Myxococcaceae bacterium]|nr:PHP domain-containing protein [Myxococcaceae bacterium]